MASSDGLEGVTIGRLADQVGMSKAGVVGHFGSKEQLQLEVLASAAETFLREVWEPVREHPPGRRRLLALCDLWVDHVSGQAFPGGCFWTAASSELDGRPGPLRDAVVEMHRTWQRRLIDEIGLCRELGELDAEVDPAQAAFELRAIAMGLNEALQLAGDQSAPHRARRAMHRVLGV